MSKNSRKRKRPKRNAKKRAAKISSIKPKADTSPRTGKTPSAVPPSFDRRLNELGMARLHAAIAERDFNSAEEVEAFMMSDEGRTIFSEPLEPTANDDLFERTQYLLEQAYSSKGNRRKKLARELLGINPDCIEAYNLLGEFIPYVEDAYPLYQEAVQRAEGVWSEQFFQENRGHFWGLLETRPYMRALASLSDCAWMLGRRDEAIGILQRMLELNPNDNQGVRDKLVSYLLYQGRVKETDELLKRYEDVTAFWNYSRALMLFASEGVTPVSIRALGEAVLQNKFVPKYLLGLLQLPRALPGSYQLGSREEAKIYCHIAQGAWKQTDGALEWLKRNCMTEQTNNRKQNQAASVKGTGLQERKEESQKKK